MKPALNLRRRYTALLASSSRPSHHWRRPNPSDECALQLCYPGVVTTTRRLAAILAADVAGYSRMMGEDETGTATAVRKSREAAGPLIAERGGRMFKTMGDGFLVEFPSVVAAVECALALQAETARRNEEVEEDKRLSYRIGIHLGDVLIEGDDLVGDGVNIAAQLEGIAAPGGICISGWAYENVVGRLSARFDDLGEIPLKNIARHVRVYAIASALVGVGGASPSTARAGPPRLSMVVLPFANLGGGPEQEYFVDGITESLTTDLSRISGAFVIARNTAFAYRGKPVDVRQIGRDLNVRYVLEGSVQRSGERMRSQRATDRGGDGRASLGGPFRQAGRRTVRHAGRDRRAHRQ